MVRFEVLLAAVLVLGVAALVALPAPSYGEEITREQQIADLERQIQELTKKLNELKMPPKQDGGIDPAWVKALNWRSIGPAAMGGRIVAISVFEADPCTYWIATASGGLLKTTNNGVTFEHQFDREATVSIGDVCVAPSNRDVVWVGTGENNPRNSVSYGDGVYKSTDGGKTWKNMGLKKSFQIGKIVVHPKDPNIVYVGALGRLYGPSEERGLFKTTNGGESWEKVLYVNDKTGIIDMQMSPADPETLLVAAWERQRDEFDSHPGTEVPLVDGYDGYDPIKKWGPGSGLYKTTDGGKTFKKLTAGLPSGTLGRIGIDYYRKDPRTVFAIIDGDKIGMGTPPSRVWLGIQGENAEGGGAKIKEVTGDSPGGKAGLKAGDIVKTVDKAEVKNYEDLTSAIQKGKVGDKLALTVLRDKETKEITVTLEERPESQGGRSRGAYLGIIGESLPEGVRISQLRPDSPASKGGLEIDDLIKFIDKKEVTSFRQMSELLRGNNPGDKITVTVQREKDTKDIVVTLEGFPEGASKTRPYTFWYGGQRENVQDKQGPNSHEYGGVYKSTDGGETWARLNSVNPRPMYFSQVRVDPTDEKHLYVCGIALYRSSDAGKTFTADGGNGVHPDQHCLWIDPKDGRHMIVGCDGGFYATYDRMAHWDHLNHMAIGQFYHVALDSRKPYRVYGGLQDNGSWGGPSHSLAGSGPRNDDWAMLAGGDGFVCRVDATDPDLVYFESQDGNMGRRNVRTGEMYFFRPKQQKGQLPPRFNWNTPFILSAANPQIFYCAGNYVYRSLKQGIELRPISPEITRTKRGSGTALAESPRNAEVLYVGTDDGFLWVTRDGGNKWTNIIEKVGLPGPRWVASIEPSHFVEGRAYVAFDGHRSDDDEPHVYVTEDFGQSWKSLRGNLPTGSTRVLREDVENPNLLYLGNEFGTWVSLNRGESWAKLSNNLPTVAVHEVAVHPTAGEVVAATHGRSLWVLDVTPLRQMTADVAKAKAFLFRPNTATRWHSDVEKGVPYGNGSRHFIGQNPPGGAQIYYSLTKKAEKISLKIVDYTGRTVREWPSKGAPFRDDKAPPAGVGLHRVEWNLWGVALPKSSRDKEPEAAPVGEGMYRAVLNVDGEELTQSVRVDVDPLAATNITTEENEEDKEEKEMQEVKKSRIDD
jgi:photosystem II stability/assembly factor-like uncharacterized protein